MFYSAPGSHGKFFLSIRFTKWRVRRESDLEKEIDLIVYKLYQLTYDEACIVEGNEEWMSKEEYDAFTLD